jgi:hypothetical protein
VVNVENGGKIGLNASSCPVCRAIAEKNAKKAELLKMLGYPEDIVKKTENQKLCDLHLKILRMYKIAKMNGAERIFKITNGKNVRVHFGYKAGDKRSTLLLTINANGKMFIVANGRIYNNLDPQILNLFSTGELEKISKAIQKLKNSQHSN